MSPAEIEQVVERLLAESTTSPSDAALDAYAMPLAEAIYRGEIGEANHGAGP
jgi:hypothetical protein